MFVGGPESIPFEHQSDLDVDYAVGRLAFDHPDDYRLYAESVIGYETATVLPRGRERHSGERGTSWIRNQVERRLPGQASFRGRSGSCRSGCSSSRSASCVDFERDAFSAPRPPRSTCWNRLHVADPKARPSFLFTASHGLSWPKGNVNQYSQQGSLLCQEWPGAGTRPQSGHCLTAADVDDDAKVHGLVAFLFACYGAGTPAIDHFLADRSKERMAIAENAFVAALPQRLLAHPGGGALAVFGHVERAWSYSIRPPGVGTRLLPFRNLIGRVLRGKPVGMATKDFSDRYSNASVRILDLMARSDPGTKLPASRMAAFWVERNDAQNYILLGDPAVRLRVDSLV